MFIIAREKFNSVIDAQIGAYMGSYKARQLNDADSMDDAIEKAEAIINAQPLFTEDRVVIYKKTGSELMRVHHEKLMTVYMDNVNGGITHCKHLVNDSQANSLLH